MIVMIVAVDPRLFLLQNTIHSDIPFTMCKQAGVKATTAQDVEVQSAIAILGEMLDRAADEGMAYLEARKQKGRKVEPTVYDSAEVLDLPAADYLQRWCKYLPTTVPQLLLASVYIDRFVEMTCIPVTPYNKHRVMFCALVCTEKWMYDFLKPSSTYATVGGIHIAEYARLERSFLVDLDFSLFVSEQEIACYNARIIKPAAVDAQEEVMVHAALPQRPRVQKSSSLEQLLGAMKRKKSVTAGLCSKAIVSLRKLVA